ncbi:MAG: ArsR/SmtB family transcription factor [Coprobacillaceae bacterium]
MSMCEHNQELLEIFEDSKEALIALGNENRQHIVVALIKEEGKGVRVNDIAKAIHLSRPATSHHLQILKAANIINMYQIGTKNYYYIDANESEWHKLSNLTTFVYQTISKLENIDFLKESNKGDIV